MKKIWIVILAFFLTNCDFLIDKRSITVKSSQTGLLFGKKEIKILQPGTYEISKYEYPVIVEQYDSIEAERFDILDVEANALSCEASVTYKINGTQLKSIADLMTYSESVEKYKSTVLIPELMSAVREICISKKRNYILSNNEKKVIKEYIGEKLKPYINISSLKLNFHPGTENYVQQH